MDRRMLRLVAGLAVVTLAGACAQSPESPMSPSAVAGETAANPDGSTLKVNAPKPVSPADGATVETRRPAVVFENSTGRFTGVTLAYSLQVFDNSGTVVGEFTVPQAAGGQTSFEATADLAYSTEFRWRVRAVLDGQVGPWSALWMFRTPAAPAPTGGGGGGGGSNDGPIGPPRSIGYNEAVSIIINIHDRLRINLGSASTRDYRIAFLNAAVAAIHYGHGRWNPQGPDTNWCVKDAGGGRPQSDDVIVMCRSRDAWDLIGGAGANGYFWHNDYLGVLPSVQNVYPPPRSALNFFN